MNQHMHHNSSVDMSACMAIPKLWSSHVTCKQQIGNSAPAPYTVLGTPNQQPPCCALAMCLSCAVSSAAAACCSIWCRTHLEVKRQTREGNGGNNAPLLSPSCHPADTEAHVNDHTVVTSLQNYRQHGGHHALHSWITAWLARLSLTHQLQCLPDTYVKLDLSSSSSSCIRRERKTGAEEHLGSLGAGMSDGSLP